MAGGRGTRISSVASDIPKPMIKIDGVPVLEREICCLASQGYDDILITVGHLGRIITDYFGDGSGVSPVTGRPFGVNIEYYFEEQPLGNAGALFEVRDKLKEDFLLLNADAVFDVDFNRFTAYHRRKGGLATLFTHPNSHPYDSALIVADQSGAVTGWLTKEDARPAYYKNRVNAGLHVLSPKLLERRPAGQKVDLDRQILKPLAGAGSMFAYDSTEYVKDMGTPERYEEDKKNLADFSLVIIINLSVALVTAWLFIPSLLDRFPIKRSAYSLSVRRRRRVIKWNRFYVRYIDWGQRHRWVFMTALVAGFGIPLCVLPAKVAEDKPREQWTFWERTYNGRMRTTRIRSTMWPGHPSPCSTRP